MKYEDVGQFELVVSLILNCGMTMSCGLFPRNGDDDWMDDLQVYVLFQQYFSRIRTMCG